MDEWTPESLVQPLSEWEQRELNSVPIVTGPIGPKPRLLSNGNNGKPVINLASFNFCGLAGNEQIKEKAIETLRKYGVGSCGPPGFYGTIGGFESFVYIESVLVHTLGRCTP